MRYSRDMRGYGASPPNPAWPGGANVAVQIVLNYEEGGENCILHGDSASEAFLSEIPGAVPWPGQRHWNMESVYEYGARAGFWRLHRMFTELGTPVTVYGVATALMRSPEQLRAMQEADWEIASHGLKWVEHKDMPPEVEREQIAEAIRLHTLATGERPRGWYTGRCSVNTVDLVSQEGGFEYVSDTYDDDLPYWREHAGRAQLIIPYTLETNDMRFGTPNGFNSGDQFFAYLKDTFDVLYAEGAAGRPKMFSVGLHCRLVGRPGRAAALRRFLEYVGSHDKVWFARRIDIARHWARTHPHRPAALTPSRLDRAGFMARFGSAFRNGEWIAERAWDAELGPANDSPYGLFFALRTQFRAGSPEERLNVLRGYTPLNRRIEAARIVADEAQGDGLDAMTEGQRSGLLARLDAYRERFGFDAVVAVRGHSAASLLSTLDARMENDAQAEIEVAAREAERIALINVEAAFVQAEGQA
ncbi:allantoinase PuuE [Alsobacter sp. SYSU M60028]|uniref:Chitooligosaccharide deacetylase n=1 Tax=Alsobacter ponti TaxID=2962936 RepID=A0ABT1LC53_9HYPH|nr:allantoinase PuuE [Alsobacter ponti]MCP8939090.1 allantoinase PuuE [Alsobacter ponti]